VGVSRGACQRGRDGPGGVSRWSCRSGRSRATGLYTVPSRLISRRFNRTVARVWNEVRFLEKAIVEYMIQ
jgi:hypothetical protein